jgi:hypothetical protein
VRVFAKNAFLRGILDELDDYPSGMPENSYRKYSNLL